MVSFLSQFPYALLACVCLLFWLCSCFLVKWESLQSVKKFCFYIHCDLLCLHRELCCSLLCMSLGYVRIAWVLTCHCWFRDLAKLELTPAGYGLHLLHRSALPLSLRCCRWTQRGAQLPQGFCWARGSLTCHVSVLQGPVSLGKRKGEV